MCFQCNPWIIEAHTALPTLWIINTEPQTYISVLCGALAALRSRHTRFPKHERSVNAVVLFPHSHTDRKWNTATVNKSSNYCFHSQWMYRSYPWLIVWLFSLRMARKCTLHTGVSETPKCYTKISCLVKKTKWKKATTKLWCFQKPPKRINQSIIQKVGSQMSRVFFLVLLGLDLCNPNSCLRYKQPKSSYQEIILKHLIFTHFTGNH